MSEPTPDENDPEYGLVMPFVTVTSKGGPHDDDAYVAGYEMGQLDATLVAGPAELNASIRTVSASQADLIAMKHGYRCTAETHAEEPEWTIATFEPVTTEEDRRG